MYTTTNFKSKKELKEAVAKGEKLTIFAPGLGTPKSDGVETVCGPHYPKPHKWYAQIEMKDGLITRVIG
jgi:hypothetical protein